MVSAAEQLASNINFSAFAKAEELKKRIWFTLGALIIYRLGTYIPLPGIDPQQFADFFKNQASGLLGMFDMFSGGAASRHAIFALNIMPYISASIIIQLMTAVVPHLEQLKKEGTQGQKKITQYTRYATVLLATVQAYGLAIGFSKMALPEYQGVFVISTVITMVGGTVFLMWLGEQITARGVGNGISLIIFAGIVAEFPSAFANLLRMGRDGVIQMPFVFGLLLMTVLIVAFVVFMERAQRRLLVQYPKRQIGNKMFQGDSSHLPLKLNTAGVIPAIFSTSVLLLPATYAAASTGGPEWLATLMAYIGPGQVGYHLLHAALIIFFTFFYVALVFNPNDTADNLKKNGGFIPGIRPGAKTAEYIDYVLTRITVIGALYLTAVVLLPDYMRYNMGVSYALGGTSLLIVVSVTMDTVAQIQSHMLAHQYEGLIKKAKLRGSRRR